MVPRISRLYTNSNNGPQILKHFFQNPIESQGKVYYSFWIIIKNKTLQYPNVIKTVYHCAGKVSGRHVRSDDPNPTSVWSKSPSNVTYSPLLILSPS
ncbi:hypothetical protein Hanom_Chr08g00693901 [Helianthus anomalus]